MTSIFVTILIGKGTKKQHGFYILITFVLLLLSWGTAQLFFDGTYSIFVNSISNQGRTDLNPLGWWGFTLGTLSVGIGLIPHFLYIYRKWKGYLKWLVLLSTIVGMVASVSFGLVGCVPGNINKPLHRIFANTALYGYYASAGLFLLVFILRKIKRYEMPRWVGFLFTYILFAIVLTAVFLFPELETQLAPLGVDPKWFAGSFWQWVGFVNVLLWLVNMYLITLRDGMGRRV
jgi:hypothetical protein